MSDRSARLALPALAAGLVLAACGSTSEGDPAEEVVSVNQPATELLLSLGLSDRIVAAGLGDTEVLPELADDLSGLTLFGEEFPSFEAVLEEEPDLVYATFDDTYAEIGDVATLVGVEDRGEELVADLSRGSEGDSAAEKVAAGLRDLGLVP